MPNVLNHFIVYKGSLYHLPVTLFLPHFSCPVVSQLFLVASDCNSGYELFLIVQLLACLDDALQGDHSLD